MDPDEPKFTLYIAAGEKHAQLCCTVGQVWVTVELKGREARALVMLMKAYLEDAHLPARFRGFRLAIDVGLMFGDDPFSLPVEAATITSYWSRAYRRIEDAAETAHVMIQLIERIPNMGVRILHPIEICYVCRKPGASRRPASAPAEPESNPADSA